MLTHAKQVELRESMRALKQLYLNRQYTQCVQYGEQPLKESDNEVRKHEEAFPYSNHQLYEAVANQQADPPRTSGLPEFLRCPLSRHSGQTSYIEEPVQGAQRSREALHGRD